MTIESSELVAIRPGTRPQRSLDGINGRRGQFVSLRTVASELRRRQSFWVIMAIAGLVGGLAFAVGVPRPYTASSTLVMVDNPNGDSALEIATDLAQLETTTVAQQVVNRLHLPLSPRAFLGQYQGVTEGDSVIEVSIAAPSATEALQRANALDTAFLSFRAHLYEAQGRSIAQSLVTDVAQTQANERQLSRQIAALPPGLRATRRSLTAERKADIADVFLLQEAMQGNTLDVIAVVGGSRVLAPPILVQSSRLKKLAEDGAAGLAAGLGVGLSIVMVPPIVSDRVRRRDDFAAALEAPVALSVPVVRCGRLLRTRRLRHRLRRPRVPVALVTKHLRAAISPSSNGQSVLTVVSVGSDGAATLALAGLARALTIEGKRVVIVDASRQGLLARLLGVTGRAAKEASFSRSDLASVVIVRAHDDAAAPSVRADLDAAARASEATWRPPDVTLVLASLDPAVGARDVASWVSEATVIVTAGRSDVAGLRIEAEMLAAAGVDISGVILVGADRNDDSFGYRDNHSRASARHRHVDGSFARLTTSEDR